MKENTHKVAMLFTLVAIMLHPAPLPWSVAADHFTLPVGNSASLSQDQFPQYALAGPKASLLVKRTYKFCAIPNIDTPDGISPNVPRVHGRSVPALIDAKLRSTPYGEAMISSPGTYYFGGTVTVTFFAGECGSTSIWRP